MHRRCPTGSNLGLSLDFPGRWMLTAVALLVVAGAPGARAATATDGVSEERLSLPEGPGSLEGIGENVSLDRNMGQMSYSVPIAVPAGFPGMTPSLALSYSSGAGNSAAGVGWSLDAPFIERLTVRGLPKYTADDGFAVGGGEELVRIPATDPAVYRARFEGGFVRYTWKDAGTGADGYWTAEYPDGRVGYFGADATGATVAKARVAGPKGTFRYLLVSMVDRYGHRVDWAYDLFDNKSLPVHVGWVFVGGKPEYEATFAYEDRTDRISDCRAGFEELLAKRLSQVNVLAHGTRIRRYALSYDAPETSGGLSRLKGVQMYGKDDGAYPIHESFEYQRALGVDCTSGQQCEKPYVVSMGALGVDLQKGTSTLIDLNGDGLPDLLDASEPGKVHRIFLNTLKADGTHQFSTPFDSALGNQGGFDLGSPYVQTLDVDGDGFADLLNAQTGQVLYNRGTGDWAQLGTMWTGATGGGLPDLNSDFDPSQGSLRTVRFLDYDNDKRIDVVRSEGTGAANQTFIYRNTGNGGFELDAGADNLGAGFESDRLELNDMNGDGLQDVVLVNTDSVRYRLNLGWGHWGDWVTIPLNTQFTNQEAIDAELDDLNGDALADLVLVQGTTVRYWLNRNGATFDAERDVTAADVNGEIPERLSTTTVFQADMDGNGSNDIVWIDGSGKVTYLELFPTRPNLLSKITNGIGRVTQVTYASSVLSRAADQATAPWTHALPFPMTVVQSTDDWDELTNVHTVTTFTYHDGYYDGAEKRFRGYAKAESALAGDEHQQAGTTLEQYDVGVGDAYRAGLLLVEEQVSGGHSIQVTTHTYEDCPVAGLPDGGLAFPVRHVCETAETVEHREGVTDPAQWVTTATTWAHDGYGNVTLESRQGETAVGGGACDACAATGYTGTPCGAKCLGDERYTATTYATPDDNDDRWLVRLPVRVQAYGVAKADGTPATDVYTETTTYYDGDAFTGLPAGHADHGTITRITERADATGKTIDQVRNMLDADGNVVEMLDPLGAAGSDEHRRLYTMDPNGLRVTRVDLLLKDAAGAYALRREVRYDPVWDLPVENTSWRVVAGGTAQDDSDETTSTWDQFGRLSTITRPGDPADHPTEEFTYDLKSPASRIVTHLRSASGGDADQETVRCLDGRGRVFQNRIRLAGDSFRVSGFTVYNAHGLLRTIHAPYAGTGDACDVAAPTSDPSIARTWDALGREVGTVFAATKDDAVPPTSRTVYGPASVTRYDPEDTAPGGANADTPTVVLHNGLGQSIAVQRWAKAGTAALTTVLRLDDLGFPAGTVDPAGYAHGQTNDLLGRVVGVDDPDSGAQTRVFDDAGRVLTRTDARGVTLHAEYDGANRMTAQWDAADPTGTRTTWTFDRPGDCPADQCSHVAGRLASTTYPIAGEGTGIDLHGYTARGNESWVARTLGGRRYEFTTTHDALDRVVGNGYPTGLSIPVTLDGQGEVAAVPGYIDGVVREARGLPSEVRLHNQVVATWTHDERMRLVALAVSDPAGAPLLSRTYRRDLVGNATEVADALATAATPSGNATFAYDAMYRLVQADLDHGSGDPAEVLTWQHDAADRILKKVSSLGATSPAHAGDCTYGDGTDAGPHAVTRAGTLAYQYDAAGHAVTRGDVALAWDSLGRLATASRGGAQVGQWGYGAGRDRVFARENGHETWSPAEDFEVRDGTAFTWVTLGADRLVQLEDPSFAAKVLSDLAPAAGDDGAIVPAPDGAITAGDAWLSVAIAAGVMTPKSAADASRPEVLLHASARRMLYGTGTRVVYLHPDAVGSPLAWTDEQGAVLGRAAYFPFGETRWTSGEPSVTGFQGKERDETTGWLDFGGRTFDPVAGRWTSPDPAFLIQDSIDENRVDEATGAYAFVAGNPVNERDPDGQARVGSVTSFLGRVKTALALRKGTWRPSLLYHYLHNLTPGAKISFREAWHMVKLAAKTGESAYGVSKEFHPTSHRPPNFEITELQSAGHTLAKLYNPRGSDTHFKQVVAPELARLAHGLEGGYMNPHAIYEHMALTGFQTGLREHGRSVVKSFEHGSQHK